MTIQEAIKARHAVRAYTDRKIEKEKLEALTALMEQLNREGGLHMQLVVDEPKAFDSRMAHYGKFAGVSNYFAMIGPKGSGLDEKLGYYGEQLVLRAQILGLNTCWVGLTFKKTPEAFTLAAGEKLRLVITLGYGTTQGVGHKVKSIEKVSQTAGPMPDWFRRGVEAALLAPTAVNQQKFRFILKPDGTVQAKSGLGFFSKVDLGIVKYHFEVGAGKENVRWA